MTSPETQNIQKPPLAGLPLEELTALLRDFPAYRAKQIYRWLKRAEADFNSMTDIPADFRLWLADNFSCRTSRLAESLHAADGTQKARILLADGAAIEAVLLSDGANRRTACLSTQAGCPVGCIFCKTGSLGFKRNLISAEIVEQLYILSGGAVIDNIVLMGMGEPLLNLAELRRALAVILDGFSPRRVTLSTCGIIPGILALANEGPAVRLALSVPSAREELRERLVPFCAKYPLADLKAALARWQALRGQRITVETALLGGINTAKEDAAALAAFVSGLEALVNIIPWNPADGLEFEGRALRPPEPCETANFMRILKSLGVKAELRRKKGGAVCGACGQLGVTEAGSPKN